MSDVLRSGLARVVDGAVEATVVLSFSRVGHRVRSRLEGWQPAPERCGVGRRVLITGANSGLGYATARALLASGARVLITTRSVDKGADTLRRLAADVGRDVSTDAAHDVLDLASLASVRAFAQRQLAHDEPLDTIVHNAGALFAERDVTVDGLERTYQIHVVAPFLVTSLLLPRLAASAPARVVTVTSGGMYTQKLVTPLVDSPRDYRGSVAYARAKRAQVVLTREWARRCADVGVGFHVAHPGWALTPGIEASLPRFRSLVGPILRDPDEGADTIVFLALVPSLPTDGQLWHDRRRRWEHKVPWTMASRGEGARLWRRVCIDAGVDPASSPGGASPGQ